MKHSLLHSTTIVAISMALAVTASPLHTPAGNNPLTAVNLMSPQEVAGSAAPPFPDTVTPNVGKEAGEEEDEQDEDNENEAEPTSSSTTGTMTPKATWSPSTSMSEDPQPTDPPPSESSSYSSYSSTTAEPTSTDEPTSTRDILPVSSPDYLPDFEAPDFKSREDIPTGPLTRGEIEYGIDEYPEPWKIPEEGHPEIEAAMNAIDWDHVPKINRRSADKGTGDLNMDDYDVGDDTACWWSATGCVKPKVNYLPEDVYMCSDAGDWGLTFDDGPLNPRPEVMDKNDGEDPYAEPYLYDLLANTNQSATLFYVGSNVIQYPEAAKRAFDAGHTLCLHTWSHNAMTTLSDEQVVAELYWSLRAVKEATGVTSRCWRPPYGDVDDRVRSIAHQMGLRTVLWDRDSQDWKLESMSNKGSIQPEEVDNYFTTWINDASGNEEHGHISLQHELNEMTIGMAEKWLPKMQETFKVKPIHECTSMENPYWELDEKDNEQEGVGEEEDVEEEEEEEEEEEDDLD